MTRKTGTKRLLRKGQRGFALVDAGFWSMALVAGIGLRLATDAAVAENQWAVNVGAQLREINAAVAELVTEVPDFPDGEYSDLNILRSADCADPGLAMNHYLPCSYNLGGMLIGDYFQNIVVTSIPSSTPGQDIKIASVNLLPIRRTADAPPDPALAGVVAAVANGYGYNSANPVSASGRTRSTVDMDAATVRSAVQVHATTDYWLRSDGLVDMQNHLSFELVGNDPQRPAHRIANVRDIQSREVIDWDDEDFGLNPSGRSVLRNLDVTDRAEAQSFARADGGGEIIDPSGQSTLNAVSVGRMHLRRDTTLNAGDPCTDNGRVRITDNDKLVSCVDGLYKEPSETIPANAIVALAGHECPEGFAEFNQADGRALVGMGSSGSPTSNLVAPYSLGDTAGTTLVHLSAENNPEVRMRLHGTTNVVKIRESNTPVARINAAGSGGGRTGNFKARITRGVNSELLGGGASIDIRQQLLAITWCRRLTDAEILAGG